MPSRAAITIKRLLPTNPWKILAIIFALLNLKNLPFAWHLRLLRGLYTHIHTSRLRLQSAPGPTTLFRPLITSSRSGPLDCDYNLHKSNSTYFSDFDVGRLQLLVALCGHGINVTRKELLTEMPEDRKSGLITALGGVAVNFRKEIKPFEKFEVWTRILAWDRKWLYLVGHFVKPGSVRVEGYTLQPWKKGKGGSKIDGEKAEGAAKPVIFASAIAKYVFKKGRLTIPPERVLRASQLLPPMPVNHESPPVSETPNLEGTAVEGAAAVVASAAAEVTPSNAEEILAASMTAKGGGDTWDWQKVEEERLRGMKIAELYNGLDALNGSITGEGEVVLGSY